MARKRHQKDQAKDRNQWLQLRDVVVFLNHLVDFGQPHHLPHSQQAKRFYCPETTGFTIATINEVADVTQRQYTDKVDQKPPFQVMVAYLFRVSNENAGAAPVRCAKLDDNVDDEVYINDCILPEFVRPELDGQFKTRPQWHVVTYQEQHDELQEIPDG